MRRLLKLPVWIVPLAIAAVVAVFGYWGNLRLRDTLQEELRDQLNATLDANVTALHIWTTNQIRLASLLAEQPGVRNLSQRILENPLAGPESRPGVDAERFGNFLRPQLAGMGYEIADLVTTNFRIAASSGRLRLPLGRPIFDAQTNKFAELFASGQPVLITPFKPELNLEGRFPRPGMGPNGTNFLRRPRRGPGNPGPGGRRGEMTLMQVAAPVHDLAGAISGALALVINPDLEFSRILSVARSGDSGETYAFDQTGLLISHSRFDVQLRQIGLLNATNTSSALFLRLHDPGGDLTAGYQPADTNLANRPLIRLAADAVEGLDGAEVEPFRDYRGVPVVAAWRWLPHLGFGVATQIDAAEAYRPLQIVQLWFLCLLILLLVCAVGMFLFSYANTTSRRRLSEAEIKLKQLGQYTLEEKIGAGGMGVVYRARHALMRRATAVKLLLPDRADPETIQRFEREVCHTCRLTHPNTIQVYDYGHTPEGIFYYVMELLNGLNLHDLVARYGPLPESRVVHLLVQVCDSLAEAHALGLIHRDIKPGNVFLCDRGGIPDCVKVLDFGLVQEYHAAARQQMNLAGRDMLEGTPWFMPPEAIRDAISSDPRSDLYSVGALAYYLLTGTYAYGGETVREIHAKQLAGPPPLPSTHSPLPLSGAMDTLVLDCLAANPEHRPQNARELRARLLATPHAHEWSLPEQTAWWEQFHRQAWQPPVPAEAATPLATVKIDINTRLPVK